MSAVTQARVRGVERVVQSVEAPVGSFTVRRALPERQRHSVGPWVFLDHFGPYRATAGDGVGAHPHAGIETVTYLLSGRNEHRDSAGNVGVVGPGGAQWMTAGRGIVHAERALLEAGGEAIVHGIQLWTSLPRLAKLTAPRYQALEAQSIPEVQLEGARVRLVAGELAGARGPAQVLMPLVLAHVRVEPRGAVELPVPASFEMAAYVVDGIARGEGVQARRGELVLWGAEGESVRLENGGDDVLELMLLGGAPAEGPLVFHGPFVMNTVDQVRAAEVAYRTGRMGTLEAA
jgi:redox-sensitive bicupin YhaK (pirin superfamily)